MMHRRFLILLLFSFGVVAGLAQEQGFSIQAGIRNYGNRPVFLQEFYGADNHIIDSVITNQSGHFSFQTDTPKPAGVYRLLFDKRQFLDVVYTGEPISFTTESGHLLDSIRFIRSADNQIYYQYLNFRAQSQYRLSNLRKQITSQSIQQDYRLSLRSEIISLMKQERDFSSSLISKKPASLVSMLMLIDRTPEPDPLWSGKKRSDWIFDHYLDAVTLHDTALLRTNALSARLISYLSLVLTKYTNADSIEIGFREAALNLLSISEAEEKIFTFVRKYLSDGFMKLGYAGLSREIAAIPTPCYAEINTENGILKNQAAAQSLTGLQFPEITCVKEKMKITLPRKGTKIIVLLPASGCRWSDRAEAALTEIARDSLTDSYSFYKLMENEIQGETPDNTVKTVYLDKKAALRIKKFTDSVRRPLILVIDGKGMICNATSSWIELRDKLGL